VSPDTPLPRIERRDRLAALQAIALATFAVIPAFLVGALAVGIRAELGFGPAALGLAIAWFFTTTGLGASVLGQLVDHLDNRTALSIGAVSSAVALFGVAAAPTFPWLLLALTLGGLANALSQPAVNASLSRRIPAERLGLAFGIKQSAIPAATLLGGLAVPTLGASLGWRGTFVAVGVVAALGGAVAWTTGERGQRRARPPKQRLRESQPELRSLIILTIGGTLGAAAATSLGAFLVDAAATSGIPVGRAGLLAAVASAGGLASRVVLGWWVDRHPTQGRYRTITTLLLIGSPGFVLLATGSAPAYLVGAVLGYAAGWGWTGLFHYTVVSQNPGTPASSTGVIQTGLSLGAGLGPLLLGTVAERTSYSTAWLTASVLSLAGAGFFAVGLRHLRRFRSALSRPTSPPSLPRALRWEAEHALPLAEGVAATDHEGGGLQITLLRLAPGRSWRARSQTDGAVLFVVQGETVEFGIGAVAHRQSAGEAVTLPANLIWTAGNAGTDDVLLALVRGGAASDRP
jgi:predicted MFS family arabinose efflux permease